MVTQRGFTLIEIIIGIVVIAIVTLVVTAAAYSPDGKFLAVGLQDGSVSVWDIAAREVRRRLGGGNDIFVVQFSGDGSVIIAADGKQRILLWNNGDIGSGSLAEQIKGWAQSAAKADRPKPKSSGQAGELP